MYQNAPGSLSASPPAKSVATWGTMVDHRVRDCDKQGRNSLALVLLGLYFAEPWATSQGFKVELLIAAPAVMTHERSAAVYEMCRQRHVNGPNSASFPVLIDKNRNAGT